MDERPGPASFGFVSQRQRLSYVDWGNAAAPTLLLVHGSRDHARSWDWTAEALRADWHVVALDLRGHGDSAWSPEGRYDFATYLYDLAQLVRQLGDRPLAMVGHSLGAHIALRFAGLYPDKVSRLVAVEAVGAPPRVDAPTDATPADVRMRLWIEQKRDAAARAPRLYDDLAEAAARMIAENPRLSPERAQHLTRHGAVRSEDGRWSWKFDNLLRVWPYPDMPEAAVEALWRAITCPVLLVHGQESWPSDVPGRLRAALPAARHLEMAGAGHWPHHDRFDAFVGEVMRFLSA
ncbi:alpha/beta fold hydrolase [Sphingomonas jatrophae]|uniref:Lysophospholipase, alpha-beta hydrolase superfamily n=1 Tax=Sphingomonas jatrophae TaxID=1166337 RepID=A0A1I6KH93_9SPHN|nr:alpha/beta hydrolase [Sphingomonas jatrophae]SFR90418.1 Lysophospholipase, alpha-beta hydrolase superfamily [Sphingomonas jatrophae]